MANLNTNQPKYTNNHRGCAIGWTGNLTMKPLSEEELTKCAEAAWQKASFMEISHSAFVKAYKQGYAKCVWQISEDFNALISICETGVVQKMHEQRDDIIKEVMQRLRELNLKQCVVLFKDTHKLEFTEDFYEDFEKMLKGGAS